MTVSARNHHLYQLISTRNVSDTVEPAVVCLLSAYWHVLTFTVYCSVQWLCIGFFYCVHAAVLWYVSVLGLRFGKIRQMRIIVFNM